MQEVMSVIACRQKSSHNRVVIEYLGWLVLALIAAVGVLVTAAVVSTDRDGAGRGVLGFIADVRAGLKGLVGGKSQNYDDPPLSTDDSDHAELSGSMGMDDFFAAHQHAGDGYMQATEITDRLEQARAVIRTRVPVNRTRGANNSVPSALNPPRQASGVSGHSPASETPAARGRSRIRPQN